MSEQMNEHRLTLQQGPAVLSHECAKGRLKQKVHPADEHAYRPKPPTMGETLLEPAVGACT